MGPRTYRTSPVAVLWAACCTVMRQTLMTPSTSKAWASNGSHVRRCRLFLLNSFAIVVVVVHHCSTQTLLSIPGRHWPLQPVARNMIWSSKPVSNSDIRNAPPPPLLLLLSARQRQLSTHVRSQDLPRAQLPLKVMEQIAGTTLNRKRPCGRMKELTVVRRPASIVVVVVIWIAHQSLSQEAACRAAGSHVCSHMARTFRFADPKAQAQHNPAKQDTEADTVTM